MINGAKDTDHSPCKEQRESRRQDLSLLW